MRRPTPLCVSRVGTDLDNARMLAGGRKQSELRRGERHLHLRLEDRGVVGGDVPPVDREVERRQRASGVLQVQVGDRRAGSNPSYDATICGGDSNRGGVTTWAAP